MDKVIGLKTNYGVITGRDGIYLDSINYLNENELILTGEFNINPDFKAYEITFSGIVYLKSIELDFDERGEMESFGIIDKSKLLKKFLQLDHSNKVNSNHKHFYFKTYDTVFEIIADKYILKTK